MSQQLTIGLFGFGVVGESLYKVLRQTPSLHASIKKICIKHPGKKRNAPDSLFTSDPDELLNDGDINVVIELINDSDAAFQIVRTAMKNGKHVISASKKMISEHIPELLDLQKQTGRSLLYEAAACASIPVIRNLEEYYDNDLLHSIRAIVNGSTNFILTKMFEEGVEFSDALLQAQQSGFAESDPTLDLAGFDALHKWSFLLTHAYGIIPRSGQVLFSGIQNISAADARTAESKKMEIKLVAQAKKLKSGKLAAFVLPQFVCSDDPLSFVKNEYNGVQIESSLADKQFFFGKGAGGYPTASAVLSDLSALRYQYKYEYKKLYHHTPHELANEYYLRVFLSFESRHTIPQDRFEWIEEWNVRTDRKYLIGVISYSELVQNNWWKENGTSLILLPDPVIEEVSTRQLKKRSLELAGLV